VTLTKIKFYNLLINWYDIQKRSLPWRDDPTAFRVWISEMMLQQTRVETVIPYFAEFVKRIPEVTILAKITDDELYKLWQGLGYYNRAKNLKKAANIIMNEFDGVIPSTYEELIMLPGIGPYSAGAISSIAFNKKYPAIDGNVLRVIARIFKFQNVLNDKIVKKKIEEKVKQLLPDKRVGDFNQALMEIGAIICLPKGKPNCLNCPFQFDCMAYREDLLQIIPAKKINNARRIEYKTILLLHYNGLYAIHKRLERGLLSNLWEYPNFENYLSKEEVILLLQNEGYSYSNIFDLEEKKHIFSHLEWYLIGYNIEVLSKPKTDLYEWVSLQDIKKVYSIPKAFQYFTPLK